MVLVQPLLLVKMQTSTTMVVVLLQLPQVEEKMDGLPLDLDILLMVAVVVETEDLTRKGMVT